MPRRLILTVGTGFLFIFLSQQVQAQTASFVRSTLEAFGGGDNLTLSTIYTDFYSDPVVVDWDSDGDYDLIVGAIDGTLSLYTNDGSGNFTETTNYASIDVGSNASPDVIDWDGDGDYDLIVGENDGKINLYTNDGLGSFTETTGYASIDVGDYSSPDVIDWDGDGDYDLIVGEYNSSLNLYTNDGSGNFTETTNYASISLSNTHSSPDVIDWDGDGDYDLIVGEEDGTLNLYTNDGSGSFTETIKYASIDIGSNRSSPDVIDWDGDGDYDIIVGEYDGTLNLYTNDGSGSFAETNAYTGIDVGDYSSPDVIDWDGDGDYDLVVGEHYGKLNLYTNDGSGGFTETINYASIGVGTYSSPDVIDWDGDGDYDLIVGESNGQLNLYTNDGSGNFAETINYASIDVGSKASPDVIDWDGDGDYDLIVGEYDGPLNLHTNNGLGSFTATVNYASIDVGYYSSPDVIDWDGDGDYDLIVGEYYGTLILYTNDGLGGFTETTTDYASIDVGDRSSPDVIDWDGDGDYDILFGNRLGRVFLYLQDADGDGYEEDNDCNDADANIYVGAAETCNNVDDDCDGATDDDDSGVSGQTTWYLDADADGYGGSNSTMACDQPANSFLTSDDCDDSRADVSPGDREVCERLVDENCDGVIDEGCRGRRRRR